MTSTRGEEHNGGSSVRKVTESSRLVATARAAGKWGRQSTLYQWVARERDGVHDGVASVRGAENSRLVTFARAIGDWVRDSFLYQWLTKEPEPDVIVIDLRATYTLGPFITLLDRVGARLAPWWRDSACRRACTGTAAWLVARPIGALGVVLLVAGAVAAVLTATGGTPDTGSLAVSLGLFVLGALATRSQQSWQDIQTTRSYQLLVAVLEPPESPEQQDRSRAEPAETERETETDPDS